MNGSLKLNNVVILSNATELATEVAMDLVRNNPNLSRNDEVTGKQQREMLRNSFVAKLGSSLNNKAGREQA